jgi:hypothetical protein
MPSIARKTKTGSMLYKEIHPVRDLKATGADLVWRDTSRSYAPVVARPERFPPKPAAPPESGERGSKPRPAREDCSPDGAKRNPGTIDRLRRVSRSLSLGRPKAEPEGFTRTTCYLPIRIIPGFRRRSMFRLSRPAAGVRSRRSQVKRREAPRPCAKGARRAPSPGAWGGFASPPTGRSPSGKGSPTRSSITSCGGCVWTRRCRLHRHLPCPGAAPRLAPRQGYA